MPVFSTQAFIRLQGCRQHNLKNISVTIPKLAITVMTGVSGSGKSSLAFDTLFAEGQRRYLEYLSPDARALIKQMPKAEVDHIEGLSPALAIGQQRQALYAHGTVATYTDLYDFLSLLYAKIGEQHSPITGKLLTRYSRQEIIDYILKDYPVGTRLQLLAPVKLRNETIQEAMTRLQQMGFIRMRINGQEWMSEESPPEFASSAELEVVVDRLEIKEGVRDRLAPSVETALDLSQGILKIQEGREGVIRYFTEIYVCPENSYSFSPLEAVDFNFNSPRGACPHCQGVGGQERVNESLIFWDPQEPVIDQVRLILDHLPKKATSLLYPLFQSFWETLGVPEESTSTDLSPKAFKKILHGSSDLFRLSSLIDEHPQEIKAQWKGLIPFLDQALQTKKTKGSLSDLPFIAWQTCPVCKGARLKPESLSCLIRGKTIQDLCALTVSDCLIELESWHFTGKHAIIAKDILPHLLSRLQLLNQVGLGYLSLSRQGKTLSDGEAQRIQLASQIGAKLSGLIYILDEPSLGLHRQDIQHLQRVIQDLKSLGNTIVLVEHEKSLIKQADFVLELGPSAGQSGGEIIFQGTVPELLQDSSSLTGKWLSGQLTLPTPPGRKPKHGWLAIKNANLHNLNNLSLRIPLGCLVGFCGVSGSGKSTLVIDIIGEQIQNVLLRAIPPLSLQGYESIRRLVSHEKQAERFSARSMPATYVGLMTPLRQLFAETRLAKARGYTAARFSLNKRGGRCEACEGLGRIRVNMQLMSDLFIPCEVCQGLRYNYETLQITWENKNFADVLSLSVIEALQMFQHIPSLASSLELMAELGLDYLTLGQPFNTLSGGEIQRLKLVSDLAIKSLEPTLYILDEPSSGLHLQDIGKLLKILHRLAERGHSVFVIEHHLDILRQADWLIELGPGGGPQGGKLIFEGTPSKMTGADTPTGRVFDH